MYKLKKEWGSQYRLCWFTCYLFFLAAKRVLSWDKNILVYGEESAGALVDLGQSMRTVCPDEKVSRDSQ